MCFICWETGLNGSFNAEGSSTVLVYSSILSIKGVMCIRWCHGTKGRRSQVQKKVLNITCHLKGSPTFNLCSVFDICSFPFPLCVCSWFTPRRRLINASIPVVYRTAEKAAKRFLSKPNISRHKAASTFFIDYISIQILISTLCKLEMTMIMGEGALANGKCFTLMRSACTVCLSSQELFLNYMKKYKPLV